MSVELDIHEQYVQIIIIDNGKGFEMPKTVGDLARLGKLGLVGINERTQLLKGILSLDSKLGKGTKLIVKVPL